MADVEIERIESGLLDVRIGGRLMARELIDMEEVQQWVEGYVDLPCQADFIEIDGHRTEVEIPTR